MHRFRPICLGTVGAALLLVCSGVPSAAQATTAAPPELPCILQNGCVCDHALPFVNPADGQTYGTCTACDDGFTGPSCGRPRVDCQNLGGLTANGTCECMPQWDGPSCMEKVCVNSINGEGPYSIKPPVNNFCEDCKEGYGGLNCDVCTADSGCADSPGGPKCGRVIAVPQTQQYNMMCSVDEAFLKPLGPGRNIQAKVGYECQSPSSFQEAKDGECAVSFYRIEENHAWMDAFFFCTAYECGMTESTSVQSLPQDESSFKYKLFEVVKGTGQVMLLGLCFLIAIAKYVPGPRSAQNKVVRCSTVSLFVVLVAYVFIALVVMSSPDIETVRLVTYTCERTACVCAEDPPNAAYSPFCSDSAFGKFILPTITHRSTLTCNAGTGACAFEPEDVPTRINLQCEASECIPANATQGDNGKKTDSASQARGSSWVVLLLSAVVAVCLGGLHYALVLRGSNAAKIEFANTYIPRDEDAAVPGRGGQSGAGDSADDVSDDFDDAGSDEVPAATTAGGRRISPSSHRRRVDSQSNLSSVDMHSVRRLSEGGGDASDRDPLDDDVPDEEGYEDARLTRGGGVGGGLSSAAPSINARGGAVVQGVVTNTAASTSTGGSTIVRGVVSRGGTSSVSVPSSPHSASSAAPPAPSYSLRAEGLGYAVGASEWPWQEHRVKHILRDVSFSAKSGDVVALMGSSGAGKTTLLDILAARQKSGNITGALLLDGVNVLTDSWRYRALVGYVAQEDTLLPNLTVRQTLLYAARLKLPTAFSSKTIRLIIDELMVAMGITRCAHTIIGDGANSRGLSGGEKRRVSIAVEMVANPRILFLDEPTSGLDASNALRVMEAVSLLAQTSPLAKYAPHYFSFKPIVIASIHQPSKAIFSRFTTLVLMSRGLCIYAGPCAEALTKVSEALGDVSRVPPTCDNAAEGLLMVDDLVTDTEREGLADASTRMNAPAANGATNGSTLLEQVQALKRFYASTYAQLFLLVRRSYASLMGSYYLIAAHGLVTVFMGSLMCYLYSAEPLDLPGSLNRAGSITFLLLVQSFISLSALEQLMMERKLFITERENGFYSTAPYLLSKIVVDIIPLRMIPAIVLSAIIYFPMGLRTDEGSYFLWFLTVITLFSVCVSLCVMCVGVLTSSFGSAALISSVIILWNFVFGGLLVQADTIPSALQPFRKLSPFYCAFEALLVNELDGQMCTFAPTDAAGRPSDTVIPLYCVQYLFNLGLHPDRFMSDIMMLVMQCVLFSLVAYLLLLRAQLTR